jgi:hypothetical protein
MPITCKLTTPELQKRKQTVIADLKTLMVSRTELENGYQYQFPGHDASLDWLTTFIKTERLCCDFFRYELTISNDQQPISLTLTGPEGAKDFIQTELGL